jgi:hypothetical protein
MPLGLILDLMTKPVVIKTKIAVVAATDLWKYSIINSCIGTKPAGQRGHLGQVSPTPEALTYPPINIRVKTDARVMRERVLRII